MNRSSTTSAASQGVPGGDSPCGGMILIQGAFETACTIDT